MLTTPAPTAPGGRLATAITSRRGAPLALAIALLASAALLGAFSTAAPPPSSTAAPAGSESAEVARIVAGFPDADRQPVVLVATRTDGHTLDDADLQQLARLGDSIGAASGADPGDPLPSDDQQAALLILPIETGPDSAATGATVKDLRALIAEHRPADLEVLVTGGPAFGADIALSFEGADITLLSVTVLIVALLLIGTYRSPVLWILPLGVVGLADRIASAVTASLGSWLGLPFDAGIISVLVFGAGTNYSLLLISRYREELHHTTDARTALALAWRRTVPALVASNLTVVLALTTLLLAVIPRTRGLGIPAAIGLLIALVGVLLVLPPVLAIAGRRVFWPLVPAPDATGRRGGGGGLWAWVAGRVARRPSVGLAGGLAVLAVMSLGLIGTSVGLDQAARFRTSTESSTGLAIMAEHFPAGDAQPMVVLTADASIDAVRRAVSAVPGVVRAIPTGSDGEHSRLSVSGEFAPGTDESLDLVTALRDAVHAVPEAEALVGGQIAEDLDARVGARHDLMIVAPMVLGVTFLVLVLLLRSLVAPVLLVGVNLASAVAAIGFGSWLGRLFFDRSALDVEVPVLAFLFLVALGVDYTIFLVHRIRTEATEVGTRAGVVGAVTQTGTVITSAGVVLAAVFAALGVLPLITLGQLGLIVGVGVIIDTVLVRGVIVPSVFVLMGRRIWWPGRAPGPAGTAAAPRSDATHIDREESPHDRLAAATGP